MTDTRKAMQQALEALHLTAARFAAQREAIEALREALSQQGEPMAWCDPSEQDERYAFSWNNPARHHSHVVPLYAGAAPAAQPPAGYALIGIDALKAWGKYDEVKASCAYGIGAGK